MKHLNLTPNLTQRHSDTLTHQIHTSYPGQAHFANSGPFGATCGDCMLLGYYREHRNRVGDIVGSHHYGGCKKFHELTGKHGSIVPKHAAACRYFQRKEDKP
jgi:hypothetical protein